MFLIILGTVFIVASLVLYLHDRPDKKNHHFSRQPTIQSKNSGSLLKFSGYSSYRQPSPTQKFAELQTDNFVEFSPDVSKVEMREFVVTADGLLLGLNRFGTDFSPNGEECPLLVLGENDYLFIRFKDGTWVAFNEEIQLEGESANEFNSPGEAFSQKGQTPGSHTFTWHDMSLSIIDVGYLSYRHHGGKCHLPDKTMIKFMIARRQSDQAFFYLENAKTGTDRVWIGFDLGRNLDGCLGRILSKE